MSITIKSKPVRRAIQEDCLGETNDPVFLLRHEHSMLLGKLRLLEKGKKDPEAVKDLLETIIRDSKVHFKREAILLHALAEKLKFGGRSIHRLFIEHESLLNMARQLLHAGARFSGNSEDWESLGQQFGEFAKQYRDQIHHIEKVVYLLARTRLSRQGQKQLAKQILAV